MYIYGGLSIDPLMWAASIPWISRELDGQDTYSEEQNDMSYFERTPKSNERYCIRGFVHLNSGGGDTDFGQVYSRRVLHRLAGS